MLNDVILIVNDLRARAVLMNTIAERFPHIDYRMSDHTGALFPEPLPKLAQIPFFASVPDKQHLRTALSFQGAYQVAVLMPFALPR